MKLTIRNFPLLECDDRALFNSLFKNLYWLIHWWWFGGSTNRLLITKLLWLPEFCNSHGMHWREMRFNKFWTNIRTTNAKVQLQVKSVFSHPEWVLWSQRFKQYLSSSVLTLHLPPCNLVPILIPPHIPHRYNWTFRVNNNFFLKILIYTKLKSWFQV